MRAVEKRLRERIKYLEAYQAELESDRELFRDHFARRFRWWIELLGKHSSPNIKWLIEYDAKEMRKMKWWSW